MPAPLSRRAFLAGASAAALAACSSGSSGASNKPRFNLVTFSDTSALPVGKPARLTLGVTDTDGVVLAQPPAPQLAVSITVNGAAASPPVQSTAHAAGLPRAYFPVTFTPTEPDAVYTISTQVDGTPLAIPAQFPKTSDVVGTAVPMPAIDTPTVANPLGVQLLCTRDPQCPLHSVSLKDALTAHDRVALLFATPRFCQTAICGPVLDVLLSVRDEFPAITFIHCEVYPTEAAAQPGTSQLTDAMNAFGLTFEPCLYLAAPDGTITTRLDTVFDRDELRGALGQLAGS